MRRERGSGRRKNDDLDDALSLRARAQVRRLPVVVREDEPVGVVSQADVARSDAKEKHVAEFVGGGLAAAARSAGRGDTDRNPIRAGPRSPRQPVGAAGRSEIVTTRPVRGRLEPGARRRGSEPTPLRLLVGDQPQVPSCALVGQH